ncbi:hypothetical protein JXA48_03105 [Candidatus Woesearchaeota archaeon]|nr:hypothetical protein [Candidatus Woesearchaeota archaeon]
MAESEWTTTSVKLERDLKMKLNDFCERESISPNKLIKGLIEKKLEFMLHPGTLRKDKGVPATGKHSFEYSISEDKFLWQLDLGSQKHILSKNVSVDFLEKMKVTLDKALEERRKEQAKLGDKTIVPTDVLDYEVEE